MLDTISTILAVAACVGCGLLAGVYFTFSAFVMESLARIPGESAVEAMRQINRVILGSAFMPVFFGAPIVGVASAVVAWLAWSREAAFAAVLGAACIVAGNIGVTVARHVPLNVALDRRTVTDWSAYDRPWRAWNHVRTAGCLAAALAFAVALALR